MGLIIFLLNRCSSQEVNTTDAQISRDINESKRNGFFIKRYVIEHTTDSKIVLMGEASLEKTWFYEIQNGKVIKVPRYGCKLCFNLKQTPGLIYSVKNMGKWLMEYEKTETYVGLAYGVYKLSFQNFNVPDSIPLTLIVRTDLESDVKETKIGKLIFKVKK